MPDRKKRSLPTLTAVILIAALAAALVLWLALRDGADIETYINNGDPYARGDWELVWSDEFDGTELDMSVWSYDVGGNGWGNNELQYYTEGDNLRVGDGCLVITAEHDPDGGKKAYTSSRIKTKKKVHFQYGRIEARIKLPLAAGTWPAFWMMGSERNYKWPGCGEIDIMERFSEHTFVQSHIFWGEPAPFGKGINGCFRQGKASGVYYLDNSQWHTYAIEWTENGFKFFVDGNCFDELEISRYDENQSVFRAPFYILLNTAVGSGGGTPDSKSYPDSMYVDYVRVYDRRS